jgi:hypothetical protein
MGPGWLEVALGAERDDERSAMPPTRRIGCGGRGGPRVASDRSPALVRG